MSLGIEAEVITGCTCHKKLAIKCFICTTNKICFFFCSIANLWRIKSLSVVAARCKGSEKMRPVSPSKNWNACAMSCSSCMYKGLIAEVCRLHGQLSGQPCALGACARCPKYNQAMPMVSGIERGGAKARAPGPALSLARSPRRGVPFQQPQPFYSHWDTQSLPP